MTGFLARQEQFAAVGSTNDVVRDWLAAGTPEVCLAVADEQTAGRGREGRTWVAPAGGALLLSLGRLDCLTVDKPVRVGEGLGETPGSLIHVLRLSLVLHVLYSFRAGMRFAPFEAFYPIQARITRVVSGRLDGLPHRGRTVKTRLKP